MAACSQGQTSRHISSPDFEMELIYWFYWGLMPQQQPGSYQGSEMMMMKSVFWWRKWEYPEETTELRQVTDETFSHIQPLPSPGIELGPQWCEAKWANGANHYFYFYEMWAIKISWQFLCHCLSRPDRTSGRTLSGCRAISFLRLISSRLSSWKWRRNLDRKG